MPKMMENKNIGHMSEMRPIYNHLIHGSNILSARQGDTRRGIMRTEAIQEKKREETRQPSMPISGGKNIQHEVEWRIKYRF